MKVAITAVAARKSGGSTLILERLIRLLPSVAPEHRFKVFVSTEFAARLERSLREPSLSESDYDRDAEPEPEPPGGFDGARHRTGFHVGNVEIVQVPLRNDFDRILWDQISYPKAIEAWGADVSVNALGFGPAMPKRPQVTMLQDSTYFCRWRHFQRTWSERARIALLRRLLVRIMRNSESVVLPSRALRDAVAQLVPDIAGKLVVLRDPFEADWLEQSAGREGPDGSGDRRNRRGSERPLRILYLSHLESHKAHSLLPEVAFRLAKSLGASSSTGAGSGPPPSASIRNEDRRHDEPSASGRHGTPRTSHPFVFVVAIDRADNPRLFDRFVSRIGQLGVEHLFEIHPRVSQGRVIEMLSEADVFFFPSLCESFGYPMAEAGAAGLPVVAADTPINREMLGENAVYFPPLDADKATEALGRLLVHRDLARRVAQAIQTHQRSLLFGWHEYARRLVGIIERSID